MPQSLPMHKFCSSLLVLSLFLGGGCNQQNGSNGAAASGTTTSSAATTSIPDLPTHAQPKMQTAKLWLGAEEMVAELALTPEQQRTGMMFRTNMDDNAGMLFPLPSTGTASFWMMNCPLPLSAAYISPDALIQEIHDFQPFNTNSVVSATDNIRFVLETPQGWFQKHNIGTNTVVRTEKGSLMETFFNR